jgi:hypothetical protein
MYLWESFEKEVLDSLGEESSFRADTLGEQLGIRFPTNAASRGIQVYLAAQRGPKSHTKYALHREGRTRDAVWTIGTRTSDARAVVGQFGDDTRHRIVRALRPDLHRIASVNGRSLRAIEEQLAPAVDGVVQIIGAMMSVAGWTAEDELDGAR